MNVRTLSGPDSEPITLAQAKAHLRVTHDAEDAQIARWLRSSREYAEHLAQRSIGRQVLALTLRSFPAKREIPLPMGPVVAVVAVQYRDAAGAWQTMPPADYELAAVGQSECLALAPGASWPSASSDAVAGVSIQYAAGYTEQTIPQGVVDFVLLELGTLYATRESTGEKAVVDHPFAERLLDRARVWDI